MRALTYAAMHMEQGEVDGNAGLYRAYHDSVKLIMPPICVTGGT